ncbi:hypothetical protein GCM10027449_11500 [Sinomonas notoginsengisoli]|uniref:hypothetical protein n=1 Tax=Sinomonas notoginsengisoli TaxID=1457311 RepID=UPI001F40728E|nr:hypothetical protein [Sinomonas notoginsengisoli]
MDILSGVNAEWLKNLTWIVAVAAGLLLGLWRLRRPDLAVLGAVLVFAVANTGAGIYVLLHLSDPRWGGDAHGRLTAPTLGGTPVVGQYLRPLDGLLSGLANGVNQFNDAQAALPAATGFFASAGWAFALAVPLCILSLVVGFFVARRREAEFARVRQQVGELSAEVAELKKSLGTQTG